MKLVHNHYGTPVRPETLMTTSTEVTLRKPGWIYITITKPALYVTATGEGWKSSAGAQRGGDS